MKYRLLRIALVGGGSVCCAIIISCVCQSPGPRESNKIVFEEKRVSIPGNKISAEDQVAMNKVLQEFDKSLYRVQTYQSGEVSKSVGTLSHEYLPWIVVQKVVENAKLHSLTGAAIQAGRGSDDPSEEDSRLAEAGTRPGGSKFATPSPPPQDWAAADGPPSESGARPSGGSRYGTPSPPPARRVGSKFHIANARTGQKFRLNDRELVRRLRPILEKYNRP